MSGASSAVHREHPARRVLRWSLAFVTLLGAVVLVTEWSYAPRDEARIERPPRHAAGGASFQFVALGDIEEEWTGFSDLVRAVEQRGDCDFGVILGDVAKRDVRARESYIELADALVRLRPEFPVYAVPGNHDRPAEDAPDRYAAAFGDLSWRFEHEGCLFVGLDNSLGRLTEASRRTLEDAAESAADARQVVVFLHVPLHESGAAPDGGGARPDARGLRDVRAALGRVDLVIAGHMDDWSDATDAAGTRHVTVGAELSGDWPEGTSTPQLAALCTVSESGIDVEKIAVSYRTDALTSLRVFCHLQVVLRVRRLLDPVPVSLATLAAACGWLLLLRGRRPRAA